jgi:hypothetical protein
MEESVPAPPILDPLRSLEIAPAQHEHRQSPIGYKNAVFDSYRGPAASWKQFSL